MGLCKYCNQKAGFLSSFHKECETANRDALTSIPETVFKSITGSADFENLKRDVQKVASYGHVKDDELNDLYTSGFDKAVYHFLDDGVISPEEEDQIANFQTHFQFDDSVLDKRGSWQRVVRALILRDVMGGLTNKCRINLTGNLPFLFQKDETLLWHFQGVSMYEMRTKTSYEGSSHGVSIRVAQGLYYRVGSFKGTPVVNDHMVLLGTGGMALTSKAIYYSGGSKSIKVPYAKLLAINPYSDGLGIQKDGTSSKPQIFTNLDGWFTYNLIINLKDI